MNTAIIVAAGSGSRFNSTTPKQFLDLKGKPVVIHALEAFAASSAVDEMILVVPEAYMDEFVRVSRPFTLRKLRHIVPGGETRVESVKRGFHEASPGSAVVAIHDGARPLVSAAEIEATINAAADSGAACLAAPVTDTVKEVKDGIVVRTIDRENLRRALTPQAFHYEILREALDSVAADEAFTDESSIVERLGHPVSIVEGSARNIKITHPEDLALAEALIEKGAAAW